MESNSCHAAPVTRENIFDAIDTLVEHLELKRVRVLRTTHNRTTGSDEEQDITDQILTTFGRLNTERIIDKLMRPLREYEKMTLTAVRGGKRASKQSLADVQEWLVESKLLHALRVQPAGAN